MLSEITPLILTYNEAPNIGRTLEQLSWADETVVVDSFSSDETVEIVRSFPRARLVQRAFDDHTSQWNFGLDQVATEWVLSLDADYLISADFVDELEVFDTARSDICAWFARFEYCVFGRPLRGSLYPPRAVLFRKSRCRYVHDGHTQLLRVEGATGMLRSAIRHDDRKPLARWLTSQTSYARLEAEKILHASNGQLDFSDRLRKKIILRAVITPFYSLFAKRLILDGWPGIFYAMQRVYAELLLSLELLNQRLDDREPKKHVN